MVYNPDIMRVSGNFAQSDLPISRYQELAKKLYTPLLYGENSSLLFFPSNGMSYDVNNIWLRESDRLEILGKQRNHFLFGYIHLVNPEIFGNRIWLEQFWNAFGFDRSRGDSIHDFEDQLKQSIKEGNEPTFLLHIPASLSDETLRLFFEFASQIVFVAPSRIHMLICMEMRWTHEEFTFLTSNFHTLFQHISIIPAPQNEEVYHLLKHYSLSWNYPLSQRVLEHIVSASGGSFLFAKYMLRLLISEKLKTVRDVEFAMYSHAYMTQRIEYFVSKLPSKHREILSEVANGQTSEMNLEIKLLIDLDILRRNGAGFVIRSPIIHHAFIVNDTHHDVASMVQSSDAFSKREKVILLALIDAKGTTLSREKIAEYIWGASSAEKYSDWVIDQTISRIRKKLAATPNFQTIQVQTQKKKGFIVSTSL